MNLSEKIGLKNVDIIFDDEDCVIYSDTNIITKAHGFGLENRNQTSITMVKGNTVITWTYNEEMRSTVRDANSIPEYKKVLYVSKFLHTHVSQLKYGGKLDIKTKTEVEQWNPEIAEFKSYVEVG